MGFCHWHRPQRVGFFFHGDLPWDKDRLISLKMGFTMVKKKVWNHSDKWSPNYWMGMGNKFQMVTKKHQSVPMVSKGTIGRISYHGKWSICSVGIPYHMLSITNSLIHRAFVIFSNGNKCDTSKKLTGNIGGICWGWFKLYSPWLKYIDLSWWTSSYKRATRLIRGTWRIS